MNRGTFLRLGAFGAAGVALLAVRRKRASMDKPNVLFVLTDDQPPQAVMERVASRLDRDWSQSAYSDIPYCGPARVGLLTGVYPHTHGAWGNKDAWRNYKRANSSSEDLLSRVGGQGYRVGFFGKVINGYGSLDDATWVHPGASVWEAMVDIAGVYEPPYTINVRGTLKELTENPTEYFGRRSEEFIRKSAEMSVPWFCYLSVTDPHPPYIPLPEYEHAHDGEGWTSPGTEEADLSDKSSWTRSQASSTPEGRQQSWEGKLEELEAAEARIVRLLDTIEGLDLVENTLVIVASDNGYMLGEHGMSGKALPYEESVRIPFYVRVPLALRGSAGASPLPDSPLISRLDATATILTAAGASTRGVDGRSFLNLSEASAWRRRVLVEGPSNEWSVLRDDNYYLLRLPRGEEELYDLSTDPHQLESLPPEGNEALYADLRAKCLAMSEARGEELRSLEV